MSRQAIAEKVTFHIDNIDGKAPICRVIVESPRVAEIDSSGEGLTDVLEALAWSIDSMTVRRARAELNAQTNSNPLCGWGSLRFVGHG